MNDLIIAKVDQARQLLAEARNAPAAKQIADMAHAAEVYAKRQKLSQESIDYAHAVKIDAMRLLGEFLKGTPKNKGGGPGRGKTGSKREPVLSEPRPLRESLGPEAKKVSSQAQKIAKIAAEGNGLFEEVRTGKKTIVQAERALHKEKKTADLAAKAEAIGSITSDDCRIIHGDTLAEIKRLRARSVRLIFADPPYNIGIDYGEGTKADKLSDSEYMEWAEAWLRDSKTVLTDDGSLWVLIGDEYAAEYNVTLKRLGYKVRAWIKWYETFGVNQANNFNRCSRHLFYCVKDPKRFVFNADAVNRPSDRQTKYNDSRANPDGKIWDDVWQIPRLVGTAKERMPEFPTQLPIALLTPIIGCASDPGDLVVDLFAGSGSAGIACLKLKRRFIGIEKSEQFVTLARQRLLAEDR